MVVIMVAATSNISPLSSSSSFVHPRYQQTVSKRDSRSCFLVPYCTKPRLVLSAPLSLSPKQACVAGKDMHAPYGVTRSLLCTQTGKRAGPARRSERHPRVLLAESAIFRPACCLAFVPTSKGRGGDGKFHTGGVLRRRGGVCTTYSVHRTHVITLLGGIQREQPGASIPLGH